MNKYIAPESEVSWYTDDPLIQSNGGAAWLPEDEFGDE